ncbi:hypothetical protein Hypma_001650, partial [Hypsizygus marmoreus]
MRTNRGCSSPDRAGSSLRSRVTPSYSAPNTSHLSTPDQLLGSAPELMQGRGLRTIQYRTHLLACSLRRILTIDLDFFQLDCSRSKLWLLTSTSTAALMTVFKDFFSLPPPAASQETKTADQYTKTPCYCRNLLTCDFVNALIALGVRYGY